MRIISLAIIIAVLLFMSGCGSGSQFSRTASPRFQTDDKEIITSSLFNSKDRTIDEADIQRLLNGKIVIPDTVRVAIFKYPSSSINRYYTSWWTDEEYLKTQQTFVEELSRQIASSKKVKKVVPVPSLMTGSNPNMVQLRETAVRLQADVLIVYSVTSDIYYKYKMFKQNEAKAFATCETILMDVRTGVIPHTSVVTKENLAIKDQADLTDTETRKKAERLAVLATLTETGGKIAEFLNSK